MAGHVKWYDRYNRLNSEHYDSLDAARGRYQYVIAAESPLYARLLAYTEGGPFVLGEYRPLTTSEG